MSGMFGKKPAAGVDNTARRVWDKDEYRQKAAEREKGEVGCGTAVMHACMDAPQPVQKA
jgi:hypothetical protein